MSHAPRDETPEAETLRVYLREIARLPRLTPDEERELGVRIQRDRDQDAMKRLVEANLRFVVSYVKRYRGLGIGFLDLIHEGNLGLLEAARRFDPGRNVKFITYAVWWVRLAVTNALSDQRRALALPSKLSAVASRFGREVSDLASRLDHAPSPEEIAEDLNISRAEAEALQFVAGQDLSLSDPIGQDEGDLRSARTKATSANSARRCRSTRCLRPRTRCCRRRCSPRCGPRCWTWRRRSARS